MLKRILKYLCYGFATAVVAPLALGERLARRFAGRDVCFQTHNELLGLIPGKPGSFLRNAYLWLTLQRCPLECFVSFGVIFTHSGCELGKSIYAGAHCMIGLASIGDHTMLADHVYILSGKHQHGVSDPTLRFQEQPGTFMRVHIGKNCWLGTNTIVMADIGDDCIIGAGSVVSHPIPSNSVAVGNPARVVRPTFASAETKEIALTQSTVRD